MNMNNDLWIVALIYLAQQCMQIINELSEKSGHLMVTNQQYILEVNYDIKEIIRVEKYLLAIEERVPYVKKERTKILYLLIWCYKCKSIS